MSLPRLQSDSDSPSWRIITHLQRRGSATIKELEDVLGVTTTAVRQHLASLQGEGYVERRRESAGVGRPHHLYSLTGKADELFACYCDDLALTLLEEVLAVEGPERVTLVLDRVSRRLADGYADSVRSSALHERVEEMAAALEARGVLTDVAIAEDDIITLHTYNCPYHELAQKHAEICAMDEQIMRMVLGSDVSLSACMMGDGGCCTFSIQS
ncbi:MAG: MarR family transcriptional regulator [Caldilineaceae bacterium]|nr:MarR family transcriptional regulator [Caldilineaceae bacterium]